MRRSTTSRVISQIYTKIIFYAYILLINITAVYYKDWLGQNQNIMNLFLEKNKLNLFHYMPNNVQ